jgi:hypothetical protein
MNHRRLMLAVAAVTVAVVLGVALAGAARGIALYAYVLVLVAVAVLVLSTRIGRALPATPPFERLLPAPPRPDTRVVQLDSLVERLAGGDVNAFDLHHRLRPLIREIAAARLARGYAVDLEASPGRAHALVGARTWELIRPDRPAPTAHLERPWPSGELDELIGELERI